MNENWNPLELAENSKTFCVYPWIHQYIGTLGDVKPCCVYSHSKELGNLKNEDLKDIWNNENTKQLRLDMLNGVVRPECDHCNLREFYDNTSRSRTNQHYFPLEEVKKQIASTKQDGEVAKHRLLHMDVRFNNLCNFKCRTCSPHFSTQWIDDFKKVNAVDSNSKENLELQYPGKNKKHAYNEMRPHFAYLKEIYFAGGEPLIQAEHYKTLETLIEIHNLKVSIRYNTNLSRLRYKDKNVLTYWKKFKDVRVLASIDASHERAEYWRKGTIWKDIVDNRRKIITETPHVKFFLCTTLAWPNSLNIIDLHKEWIELKLIKPNDIFLNELSGPYYYSLTNIPVWKKDQIRDAYLKHIDWLRQLSEDTSMAISEFQNAIKFMYNENLSQSFDFNKFYYFTSNYDALRNEDFFKTFTEHQDMHEYIQKLI